MFFPPDFRAEVGEGGTRLPRPPGKEGSGYRSDVTSCLCEWCAIYAFAYSC